MNWCELFNYDPDTGILTWKVSRSSRQRAGTIVGSVQTNHKGTAYERQYLHVRVGRYFFLHRIIWELVTGKPIPKNIHIDHRDGDGLNNRWSNLRLATRSQNMGNRNRNRTRTRDLPKGIHWHPRDSLYVARFNKRSIKYTKSLDEAVAAYNKASAKHFGKFHRASKVEP